MTREAHDISMYTHKVLCDRQLESYPIKEMTSKTHRDEKLREREREREKNLCCRERERKKQTNGK